ncbi:MAG TPA: hypothetical protein VGE25_08910 [Sediminibacterium sp.]
MSAQQQALNVMCYIMRHLLIILIFLITINCVYSYGQSFVRNSCDSTILTKEELEKCLADTAWNANLVIATNYITNLKTDLLPKYRKIRKELRLSTELQNSLQQLKITYDTVLNAKLSMYFMEMDKNQKYLQPKAYLSSLASLQTFKFFPDIYAVLLNEIHLQLSPKTSILDLKTYQNLIDKILKSIKPDLYKRLEIIATSFLADNENLEKNGFSPLFQGTQSQEDNKRYQIVNFLLWTE